MTPLPDPAFRDHLLAWYDQATTRLPWRGERDPYRIWLSEVMLQQTRMATAIGYYERFLRAFPTVQALADAPIEAVLKVWEGLGYYARARNLHRVACLIVDEHGGHFPTTAEALQQWPGVGRYTAAAVASIAFGEPVAVLDGNVVRVLTRLIDLPDEVGRPPVMERLWQLADALLSRPRPGDYNQAMMDLGRTVCVPRRPHCPRCPVREFCLAAARGTAHLRPVKKVKAPLPLIEVAAAVIRDAVGRVLLVQRPEEGLLGGLWTLPGGRCVPGESFAACLQRTLAETLGLRVRVGHEMAAASQTLTHFRLRLRAFACDVEAGTPGGELRWAWATPAEAAGYSLGKADRDVIERLEQWQPRLFEET